MSVKPVGEHCDQLSLNERVWIEQQEIPPGSMTDAAVYAGRETIVARVRQQLQSRKLLQNLRRTIRIVFLVDHDYLRRGCRTFG
jgi:hypothetical protein